MTRVLTDIDQISIHALHEESDTRLAIADRALDVFQSTLSMRRATGSNIGWTATAEFQSTLSMRRATVVLALI